MEINFREDTIFDVVNRRNSTLYFCDNNDIKFIFKEYHANYKVEEEVAAYQELDKNLKNITGIRSAQIYKYDDNSIALEYIDGISLEEMNHELIDLLRKKSNKLLELFLNCKKNNFSFDSDLSNIFYDPQEDFFVIIDPVCESNEIKHFSFVVFTLSLIKAIGKSKKVALSLKLLQLFKGYTKDYVKQGFFPKDELSKSFKRYINQVIKWNFTYSNEERITTYLARLVFLIPIWQLIKIYTSSIKVY